MTDDLLGRIATEQGEGWRMWFAWRPVWLDQDHRPTWFRWVWRRDFELGWGCSVHQRRLASADPTTRREREG